MRPLALLLALVCSAAFAAPPAVDIPPEVKPAGQYVTLVPKTDAAAITYIGLSGVEPIPAAVLKDGRMFLLDTRGLAAGRYKFAAVASLDDEHARVDFAVIVGNPPPQPEPPGPGPGPGPEPEPNEPPPVTTKADKATYVYEKDSGGIPSGVMNALNSLNRGERADGTKGHPKILSTAHEVDATDGTGDVSEQYKLAVAEARKAGLPALVIESGGKVVRVVKAPTTKQQVMEAVQ